MMTRAPRISFDELVSVIDKADIALADLLEMPRIPSAIRREIGEIRRGILRPALVRLGRREVVNVIRR